MRSSGPPGCWGEALNPVSGRCPVDERLIPRPLGPANRTPNQVPITGWRSSERRGCHSRQGSGARHSGDVVCFPGSEGAPVNELRSAYRQATGRASAAEFVAPVTEVLSMREDGRDMVSIAERLPSRPKPLIGRSRALREGRISPENRFIMGERRHYRYQLASLRLCR